MATSAIGPRVLNKSPTMGCVFLMVAAFSFAAWVAPSRAQVSTPYVVMGYNDLGMHCMNSDFSEMLILPPFNTLHAQVIRRADDPQIITAGVTVRYIVPGTTRAADKFNFWAHSYPTLGGAPAPDTGLAGTKLSGTMTVNPSNDWQALVIPMVPMDDNGRENPYSLALITVTQGATVLARTQVVVPVSTEMSCQLCHKTPGISTASDILSAHDRLHATTLMAQRPVLCADCHSDNALGLPGQPGVSSLSQAMHTAHASRMQSITLERVCYVCHPGVRTQCQRDVHYLNNIKCVDCHGDMAAVGSPSRIPWVNEPRCSGTCHNNRPGFQYEQPGTLYRNSVGHSNVHCEACHGSPHAIVPAATEVDNLQTLTLQGHAGQIDTCAVCHVTHPTDPFFHQVNEP